MDFIPNRRDLERAATTYAWMTLGFLLVAAHGLVVVYWTIFAMGFLWALVPLAALVFLILGGLCSMQRWYDAKAELMHQDRICLMPDDDGDFEEEVEARVQEYAEERERRRISPAARGGCVSPPSGGGGVLAGAAGDAFQSAE